MGKNRALSAYGLWCGMVRAMMEKAQGLWEDQEAPSFGRGPGILKDYP